MQCKLDTCSGIVQHHLLCEGGSRDDSVGLFASQGSGDGVGQQTVLGEEQALGSVAHEQIGRQLVLVVAQPGGDLQAMKWERKKWSEA